MYEWLEKEILKIKTPNFHLINDRGMILEGIPEYVRELLPPSYLLFLEKFGGAKLYRTSGVHLVHIFYTPKVVEIADELFLYIAHTDYGGYAYFKATLMEYDAETPVFEYDLEDEAPRVKRVAYRFDRWLYRRCTSTRHNYTEEEWGQVIKGPEPFSTEEMEIIEARKHFDYQIVGVADNGDVEIRVANHSSISLKYLSLGLRTKDHSFHGRVYLKVDTIPPSQTAIVKCNCYKNIVSVSEIELFSLPEPQPEDRDQYWEFG